MRVPAAPQGDDEQRARQPGRGSINRKFEAVAPNQLRDGDTTELLTTRGRQFYLAAVIDLHSWLCFGWTVSAANDRHLTMRALEVALRRRCPSAGLLHHSDRGTTYASEACRELLRTNRIECSMRPTGNFLDNAAVDNQHRHSALDYPEPGAVGA